MSGGIDKHDVIIIGTGPTGLTLANYLGEAGVSVLVLEQLPDLIDYPRGVGVDDEAMRSFQAVGLAEQVCKHTTPAHIARFIKPNGKVLAEINPQAKPFGWSRRNAFNQPLVDRELFLGLARFPNVMVRFNAQVEAVADLGASAKVSLADGEVFVAKWIVGCDGGRSVVRETMNVTFDGRTAPKRFIVIDIAKDPIGRPNVDFIVHPKRPVVSIALPGQIRRFEFGVDEAEVENDIDISEEAMRAKLRDLFTYEQIDRLDIIRRRVYTHNARVASSFRQGRLLLAGDAAHLMPVWQGQGFNSGIRDATNLGWKLAMVVKGQARETLLDSYDIERRDHAKAMVDVSVAMGNIFSPPNILMRILRDIAFSLVARVPSWKNWVATMQWKPMPKMEAGALVRATTKRGDDPVGTIFPQFELIDPSGKSVRSDDIFGTRFVLVSWGSDASHYLDPERKGFLEAIGAKCFTIFPECQRQVVEQSDLISSPLYDGTGLAKAYFDQREHCVILVRPDRIIGAACTPVEADAMVEAMATALNLAIGDEV